MKSKLTTPAEAVASVGDGATIMVGGFMACGTPESLMDALIGKAPGNLTVIANDAGYPDRGVGKLIRAGLVRKLIASHVGLNPEVAWRMNTEHPKDRIECVLVPQGTLAERIRAGGVGLGGVLTPTGVGTVVAEDKMVVNVKGRDYLLEEPLRADFAFIYGDRVDEFGNIGFYGTTENFNPLMAMAADHVLAGAEEIVGIGSLEPNAIAVPGVLVDAVTGGKRS
jgi:acetate CoA/acetoacetate CoA-transferase alpha subunit